MVVLGTTSFRKGYRYSCSLHCEHRDELFRHLFLKGVVRTVEVKSISTMNYPKKTGFNLFQSRHCAYITYSVITWFFKILSVHHIISYIHNTYIYNDGLVKVPRGAFDRETKLVSIYFWTLYFDCNMNFIWKFYDNVSLYRERVWINRGEIIFQ